VKESEKVTEAVTELTFHYLMRISMTVDKSGTKATQKSTYNPIPKVKMLLLMMVEMDPGLMVIASDGKSTLIIRKDKFPITEMAFKKFFSCKWETQGKQQNQIQLGCLINGNQTLNNIKHAIKPNQLITWLTGKKVFLNADTLGIGKTKTIGYLTYIHPHLINCTYTKIKLAETLKTTHVDYDAACKLDDSLPNATNNMTDSGDKPTVQCPHL